MKVDKKIKNNIKNTLFGINISTVNELKLSHIPEELQKYLTDCHEELFCSRPTKWPPSARVRFQSVEYFCNPSRLCTCFSSFTVEIYQTNVFS